MGQEGVYWSISSLCPTFLLDSASYNHGRKRTMWKATVFALLLLSVQVKGSVDKERGSAVENQRQKKENPKEAEGTTIPPASDTISSGFSGNLLVVPMDGSHWIDLKALAQEIGRRGHRVTVVMPEVRIRMGPGKHYDTVTFPVPYDGAIVDSIMAVNKNVMERSTLPFVETVTKRFSQMQKIKDFLHATAESLLFNTSLISHLAEQVRPESVKYHYHFKFANL